MKLMGGVQVPLRRVCELPLSSVTAQLRVRVKCTQSPVCEHEVFQLR